MATTTRTHREIFRVHSGHVYLLRFDDGEREAAHECCYRWAETRGVPLTMGQAIEMASEIGPFEREHPLPGVYYHCVPLADFYVNQTPRLPLPLRFFLFWASVAVVVFSIGRIL